MRANYKRTERSDWMTESLASRDYYVSGHPSFAAQLGLRPGELAVIRHFRLRGSRFPEVIFLTLEVEGRQPDLMAVWNTQTYRELKALFPMMQTLTISPSSRTFQIDDGKFLDGPALREWFGAINNRFITEIGGVKGVNVSQNDSFVEWTRYNLTRDCVINDIDALLSPDDGCSGALIELKRPKRDIRGWGPYVNDMGNYHSCAVLARSAELENRTIAYNIQNNSIVRLHMNVRWNKEEKCIDSLYAFVHPKSAVACPLDSTIQWTSHQSWNAN